MIASSATGSANESTDGEECHVPTPVDALVPSPDDETLASMAKALAHSTVSEHLRILREAGINAL